MQIVVDVAGFEVDVKLVRQSEGGVIPEVTGGRCSCGGETFTGSEMEKLLVAADAVGEFMTKALAEAGAE